MLTPSPFFFFLILPRPPRSTLFPYTTLFRSVDMHAEATSEKTAMGWYLDGRVSAVVGTHTHVQTADERLLPQGTDRKSTRLNSSHVSISYAVFCLKKKTERTMPEYDCDNDNQ